MDKQIKKLAERLSKLESFMYTKRIAHVKSKSQLLKFTKQELINWAVKEGLDITKTKKEIAEVIWVHINNDSDSDSDSSSSDDSESESESESSLDYDTVSNSDSDSD
jgi:hypothetical protein